MTVLRSSRSIEATITLIGLTLAIVVVLLIVLMGCQVPLRT